MYHYIYSRRFALLLLAAMPLFGACSPSPSTDTKVSQTLPDEHYPTKAAQTLTQLSPYLPENPAMLFFGSYGSLSDAVSHLRHFHIVETVAFDQTLHDLGYHYQLNPSKRADFFKVGFNTSSGFALGVHQNVPFALFSIHDFQKFRNWFDTITNEEFGRPTYSESTQDDYRFIHMRVMDKDFACYAKLDDHTVALVPAMGRYGLSQDDTCSQLQALIRADKISREQIPVIAAHAEAPLAFWFSLRAENQPVLAKYLPDNLEKWLSAASLGVAIEPDGVHMRSAWLWNDGDFNDTKTNLWLSDIGNGDNLNWASAFLSTAPTSAIRLVFNAQKLEALSLDFLPTKTQKKYKDIKSKLTQRLFKLDVTDQVIHNIGSVWALSYRDLNHVCLAISFKDSHQSDAFFSKLNIIKKAIPENIATLTNEEGFLHAVVKYHQNDIHIGYQNGLIIIAPPQTFDTAQSFYTAETSNTQDPLANNQPILRGRLQTDDLKSIDAISQWIDPFQSIDITSESNQDFLSLSVFAKLK